MTTVPCLHPRGLRRLVSAFPPSQCPYPTTPPYLASLLYSCFCERPGPFLRRASESSLVAFSYWRDGTHLTVVLANRVMVAISLRPCTLTGLPLFCPTPISSSAHPLPNFISPPRLSTFCRRLSFPSTARLALFLPHSPIRLPIFCLRG